MLILYTTFSVHKLLYSTDTFQLTECGPVNEQACNYLNKSNIDITSN